MDSEDTATPTPGPSTTPPPAPQATAPAIPTQHLPAGAAPRRPAQPLEDLASVVSGRLHTPADPTFDAARTPWVVSIPQRPMAVLEVADAADVRAAVRWGVDHGVQVTAQPTGHGAGDALTDVLLLRTRALDAIEVDVVGRTATVGAGVKAGELLAALEGTGLAFLAGSNADPTVVGMFLTGGISWFGRAHGIGCDSVLSVEMVDGLGRVRTVTRADEPALFWALRGGGGDFGIVTRMTISLFEAAGLHGGALMWPVEQMKPVLHAFRDLTEAAPEELTAWYLTQRFPPFPEVPEHLRGRAFAVVLVAHLGEPEVADRLLAPLRGVPGLLADTVRDLPMSELSSIADEPLEPMPIATSSTTLTALDDLAIDALTAVIGPGVDAPVPVVQIRHLGGAFARIRMDAGAHGPVEDPYLLFCLGAPALPELTPVISTFFGRIGAAVGHLATGRKPLNFLDGAEDPSHWWRPPTRERLSRIKDTVDPLRTIRSNRPVQT